MAVVLAAVTPAVAGPPGASVPAQEPVQQPVGQMGAVAGQVVILDGGKPLADRSGVVVELDRVPDDEPAPMSATVRQRGMRFVPYLTVVTKGSTVAFPNEDKIFHNVFSVSRTARFDLGLYKSGTSENVVMRRAGEVDVYCNIHPEMMAKVKVVDTRYYAVTEPDGRFRIDGVPPGTYPIIAWQAQGDAYRGQVVVKPGAVAEVKVSLSKGQKPAQHMRKDGTPYGRYR